MARLSDDGTAEKERPTPEEERRLWERCRLGDEEARESLILLYRPLVFWVARGLRVPYQLQPDLVQEGMLALVRAVDRFELDRNVRFITYATYRVRGQMINYLERVEKRAPLAVEDEVLERCAEDRPQEEETSRFEWLLALEKGMGSLPEAEAQVVRSLVLQGRRAVEVARERGVDVSRIYRLQRRALARLKSWLLDDAVSRT